MFSLICDKPYLPILKEFITSINETVIYCDENDSIDVQADIEEISNIAGRYLILDISLVNDDDEFILSIEKLKFKKINMRIIILAFGCKYGDELISRLVKLGIYDIINPSASMDDEEIRLFIADSLKKCIDKPASYSDAARWDNERRSKIKQIEISNENNKKDFKATYKIPEKEVVEVEKIVTVIKDNIIGTVVIALAGVMNRSGTTHLSIMTGVFLSKSGFKTAIVEFNKSGHLQAIADSYMIYDGKSEKFTFNSIDFYFGDIDIANILKNKYDYILLDMGLIYEADSRELMRANKRIITAGVKEWEIKELEKFLSDNLYGNEFRFVFNFCDTNTFSYLKKELKGFDIHRGIYRPNPFISDNGDSEFFEELLSGALPGNKTRKQGLCRSIKKSLVTYSHHLR